MKDRLTADDIVRLVNERRCVDIPTANIKQMSAAFMQNMPFRLVMKFIAMGCYEYEPKKKE